MTTAERLSAIEETRAPKRLTILVVDDEPHLVQFVRSELAAANHRTLTANDGLQALHVIQNERVDLIVLDLMMPGMDGFETCRRIRQSSSVPIIMLSANSEQAAKVRGLNLGADDYVTKPFDPEELVARINALLRRACPNGNGELAVTREEPPFACGDLTLDYTNRTVTLRGEEVKLSPTEYRLLCQLTRNAGRVLPHEYLLTTVWGPEYRDDVEYLWVYIGYLRQKIEQNPKQPQYLLTVPGFGYRFKKPK